MPAAPGRRALSRLPCVLQPVGLEIGLQQRELDQVVLRAAASNALAFRGKRGKHLDRRGKIPAFERREAARQHRKVGAGRVTPLARQLRHLAGTDFERSVIAHHGLCQNDMHVGQPGARSRQCAVGIVTHRAPGGGVARIPGEFGTPQECRRIRHSLLRPAAVPVERHGVPIQPQCLSPIASLQFAEREMPVQMAVEKSSTRIGGEPGGQIGAGRVPVATLVTNMRERVGTMRVVRVRRHGSLDLRPRGCKLPILGQRHRMMRQEPEIVAIMRGEAVHQHRDLVLLPDAAGRANQAVWVRGSGKHQRVARPCRQMRI